MNVLVADDDVISRRLLEVSLQRWGFTVCVARDGAEAWQILQKDDSPWLAVLDWVMPEIDGLELARRVSSQQRHFPVYIIIVTAAGTGSDVIEILGAGVDDYLRKPFDPKELHARLQVGVRLLELHGTLAQRVRELESALFERERAEAELSHERDLLRILMDSIPDTISFKDRHSRFARINRAQAATLGINDTSEAYGRTDFDFFNPENARESYEDEQAIIRSGEPLVSKIEPVRRQGLSRWVTTTKVPVKDDDGRVIGTVGVSRDITEWKEAQEALHKSEESLRSLFCAIPHPVWVFDLETLVFLEVNEAAVQHYGYTREEFLGMRITDIGPAEEMARLLETLRRPDGSNHRGRTWKHQTKAGRIIDVEAGSHKLVFGDREAMLVVVQDVTDRKRLEVELQHSQKLEAVGGLAAGIAHEINTPIQYVGDNIRFLEDCFSSLQGIVAKYEGLRKAILAEKVTAELLDEVRQTIEAADLDYLAEEVPKSISQSLDGVERVATIVRAMKEFAHPGRKEKTAADLNKALTNALIVARNELKYVAEIETDLGDLPPVICHLADMNQVFLNLLVNAAQAIGEVVKGTSQRGRILVRTRRDGDAALISISDTGCGIPEEIQSRIFEPFFTTKEVGGGTGQGLAIARSIVVEDHGGSLQFETTAGQGTTFIVRLPIEPILTSRPTPGADAAQLCERQTGGPACQPGSDR